MPLKRKPADDLIRGYSVDDFDAFGLDDDPFAPQKPKKEKKNPRKQRQRSATPKPGAAVNHAAAASSTKNAPTDAATGVMDQSEAGQPYHHPYSGARSTALTLGSGHYSDQSLDTITLSTLFTMATILTLRA